MALRRKFNTKANSDLNTGFGVNSNDSGGRFINREGFPNIKKRGLPFFQRYSWFHTMLSIPILKFLLFILLVFITINIFFAGLYLFIGIEHLGGVVKGKSIHNFMEAFFFSLQTYTTVGYGRINPVGYLTSSIAAFEAFLGLLTFALATGLLYARFSKPNAYLKFSDIAVIAPYKNITALMLRFVPYRNNYLTDVEVKISLFIKSDDSGSLTNRFFNLTLELSKINALSLSWTVVHPIEENSPLYGLSEDDFKNTSMEVMVFVKGFDEAYSNTVVARTSYTNNEIIYGAKYIMMFHPDEKGIQTILELDKLNEIEKKEMPPLPVVTSV
jgi:inward rectifier potassium channel